MSECLRVYYNVKAKYLKVWIHFPNIFFIDFGRFITCREPRRFVPRLRPRLQTCRSGCAGHAALRGGSLFVRQRYRWNDNPCGGDSLVDNRWVGCCFVFARLIELTKKFEGFLKEKLEYFVRLCQWERILKKIVRRSFKNIYLLFNRKRTSIYDKTAFVKFCCFCFCYKKFVRNIEFSFLFFAKISELKLSFDVN